jgi:dynein heavy chain 2
METANMLEVLAKVHESIDSIQKVLFGSGILTSKIENEATDLLKGNVPDGWTYLWADGPEAPTPWIRQFYKRADALRGWFDRIQKQTLLESHINMSDLFHPETFLNALRQKTARSQKCSIDELKLVSSFEQGKVTSPQAVTVVGLFLQGCSFDGVRLVDETSKENQQELLNLQNCRLAWIKNTESDPYSPNLVVNIPVYYTITREQLLCTLNVPNTGESNLRVIGGVAFFLSGSE